MIAQDVLQLLRYGNEAHAGTAELMGSEIGRVAGALDRDARRVQLTVA